MNLFCDLTYGIENNSLGNTLKDYILSLGVINNVTQYISVSQVLCYNLEYFLYLLFNIYYLLCIL